MGLENKVQLVSGETESVEISLKNLIMLGKDAVSGGGLYPIESYRYELKNVLANLEKQDKENLLATLIKIILKNRSKWEDDSWFFESISHIDKYNKENKSANQVYWNDLVNQAYGIGYVRDLRASAEFFVKEWGAMENLMLYAEHFNKLKIENFSKKIDGEEYVRSLSVILNTKLLMGLISILDDLKKVGLEINIDKNEVTEFLIERLEEISNLYTNENSTYETYGKYLNLIKEHVPKEHVNQSFIKVFLDSQNNFKNANFLIRNIKDFVRTTPNFMIENLMDLDLESCRKWKSIREDNDKYVIEFHHANIVKSLYLVYSFNSEIKKRLNLTLPNDLEIYANESQDWINPQYKNKDSITKNIKNSLENAGLIKLAEEIEFPEFDEKKAGNLSNPDANIIFKVNNTIENKEILDLVSQVYLVLAMTEGEEKIILEKFDMILLEHQMKKDIMQSEEKKTFKARKF